MDKKKKGVKPKIPTEGEKLDAKIEEIKEKQEIKSQGKYEKLRAMGNILPENSEEEMAFFTFFNNFCLFEAYFIDLYIHSILHFAEKYSPHV